MADSAGHSGEVDSDWEELGLEECWRRGDGSRRVVTDKRKVGRLQDSRLGLSKSVSSCTWSAVVNGFADCRNSEDQMQFGWLGWAELVKKLSSEDGLLAEDPVGWQVAVTD